jgi:hypothetical protein
VGGVAILTEATAPAVMSIALTASGFNDFLGCMVLRERVGVSADRRSGHHVLAAEIIGRLSASELACSTRGCPVTSVPSRDEYPVGRWRAWLSYWTCPEESVDRVLKKMTRV